MPLCPICGKPLICRDHGETVSPLEFRPIGSMDASCSKKSGVWVRVVDSSGKRIPGVMASVGDQTAETLENGFATFDDVRSGQTTVSIGLDDKLETKYALPEKASATEDLAPGQVKLFTFVLVAKASAVMTVPVWVAAHGYPQTIQLKADLPFQGPGKFCCTQGASKVKFSSDGNEVTAAGHVFDAVPEGGIALKVEATDGGTLSEIEVTWQLQGRNATDHVETKTFTAVKATLNLERKSGAILTPQEKIGDGGVVCLQNKEGKRRRAKATVTCVPPEFNGSVKIAVMKANVDLYAGATSTTKFNDVNAIENSKAIEFYVEGKHVSTGKADTGLTLQIVNLSGVVDTVLLTVVETKLEIYEDRQPKSSDPTKLDEPKQIADDKKLNPGRKLYRQGVKFPVRRGKMCLYKAPVDAPCKLLLKAAAGGTNVNLFSKGGRKMGKVNEAVYTHEIHVDGEAALGQSVDVAVDAIKGVDDPMWFWVEGSAVSTQQEVKIQVDVDDVDEACDTVSFTVVDPDLTIEVVRADTQPLDDGIDYKVTAMGATAPTASGTIDKTSGKATIPIQAGFYNIELTPKDADEAEMRVNRLLPKSQDAAIEVVAPASAKYELAAKYEGVQFIAYYIQTGAYIGTDDPATAAGADDREKAFNAAKTDMEARCAFMTEAIQKAYANTNVYGDARVLKIFMAPEFYYRGKQGSYPFEIIPEILNVPALKSEIAKDEYKDWLFVLGSAIGNIGRTKQREEHSATVDAVEPAATLYVMREDPLTVANGDRLWAIDADKWKSWVVQTATLVVNYNNHNWYDLDFTVTPTFDPGKMVVFGDGPVAVQLGNPAKHIWIDTTCSQPVAPTWTVQQGTLSAKVLQANSIGPDQWSLLVEIAADKMLTFGAAAEFVDPGTVVHAGTADAFTDVGIVVACNDPKTQGVAAGWSLMIADSGGNWDTNQEFEILQVDALSGNWRSLYIHGNPTFDPSRAVAVWDRSNGQCRLREKVKAFNITATFTGFAPVLGWAIDQTNTQGAVLEVTHIAGDQYRVKVAVNTSMTTATGNIKFVNPGEIEIVNVALVIKGGEGAPLGVDGRALKELLVYKESISSVDFEGFEYGSGGDFYADTRHLIKHYQDPLTRALPTAGSVDANAPSLTPKPNVIGTTTSSGQTISEVSITGIGGGTVFTMDKITFGLEVCLDHGQQRLKRYYDGTAPPGQAKVQLQLIPSCGMSIGAPCCVADGLLFNVDATHVAVKTEALADVDPIDSELINPTAGAASDYFKTDGAAREGWIVVWNPENMPTPETV